jgi:hypothetical protein
MLTTDARTVYVIANPTARDVYAIGRIARDTDCRIIAHPDTLHAMHIAACVYGPLIARTTLAAALAVPVAADESVPGPLVLLVPSV